jgi:hypothetical protein
MAIEDPSLEGRHRRTPQIVIPSSSFLKASLTCGIAMRPPRAASELPN